ncbi:MAG: M14 family metallopeptidase [Planctomycetota bacterium]
MRILFGCLVLASVVSAERLRIDHYFTYEEMTQALQEMAKGHPDLARLESIGKSLEGRDLWALTISNQATGPEAEKAAMYIDGNIHGNEVQGAELCLYTIDMLLDGHGKDAYLTRLVDERVFYFVPCVNPDGRAAFMALPNSPHSSRGNRRPVDDDDDGLVDEDGSDDLDADGAVRMMRARDPEGRWKTGSDPRLLVRCEEFEKGEWRLYHSEGIDNDGDGEINEDGPGGYDLNRTFPSNWGPKAEQGGTSPYPLSEPETRALAEWMTARPNIACVQSYHNNGDLILRPPMIYDDDRLPRSDIEAYDALARRGKQVLPQYDYRQVFRGLYPVRGGFIDWTYTGLGAWSFTNEIWDLKQDVNADGKQDELDWLAWNDTVLHGAWWKDWAPYDHPTLGKVEIGGWSKWAFRIPPAWMLTDVCHRNATFTLFHAEAMSRVSIGEARVTREGETWRVRVPITNAGYLPTVSGQAVNAKLGAPDMATLEGEGLKVLAAGRVEDAEGLRVTPVLTRPWRVEVPTVKGLSTVEVEWLVAGKGEAEVVFRSQRGGTARAVVRLE